MKTTKTQGFINIGGVRYLSKTTYGRHNIHIRQVLPNEKLEIRFIHNDELKVIEIDDSDLQLTEYN
jgi:hypothetical protein